MIKLDPQFLEDRELRDAAKAVFMDDAAHAKANFSAGGLAGRVAERIGDGSKDAFDIAKTHADDNRGILAAVIGAILLWIAREPIFEIVGLSQEGEEDLTAQGEEAQNNSETPASINVEVIEETDKDSAGDDDEQ